MTSSQQKLQKYMSEQWICSRRQAEKYILAWVVFVNEEPAHIWQLIDPMIDVVRYDTTVTQREFHYYLYHKPTGIETINAQPWCEEILDRVDVSAWVLPIWRLDKDTSGLMLLTDDTRIQKDFMDPQRHIEKEYHLTCDRVIDPKIVQELERWVMIQWYITKPAICTILWPKRLSLTITEGKNRQVRRMLRVVWYTVLVLQRVRIHTYRLWSLASWAIRKIWHIQI